jgi:gliding motility-associated lipoprotein GldH
MVLTTVALTVALFFVGCNRKVVYNRYEHTPVSGWERNDTLFFDIPPVERSQVVYEELGLRINSLYPFCDLCLIVEQTTMPMGFIRRDTITCSLMDREGNVKGSGISYYQYNMRIADLSLNKGDSLHIGIRHNMKREILPGIADVGLLLRAYN